MADETDREQPRVQRIADLSVEPPTGFPQRVRRTVNRRVLAGDLTRFSLAGLAYTLLQYVVALFGFADRPRTDRERHNETVDSNE